MILSKGIIDIIMWVLLATVVMMCFEFVPKNKKTKGKNMNPERRNKDD